MFEVDLDRAVAVLEGAGGVVAAWLFGSSRDGHVRPGSDLDIAVLFAAPPSLDERAELRAALQEALGFDGIDLLVLDGISPIVAFEALSGRPLFCRDREVRAGFASLTAREYEDEMALAERALAAR